MNMDALTRNLRVLLRADRIIAEIHLRQALARSGTLALAVLVAAFGLLMLDIGLFFVLQERWGAPMAAFALGGANLVLALLLALMASRKPPSRDLELANELHRAALDAVGAELRGVERAVRNPLEGLLPGMVAPLLGGLWRGFRSKRGKGKPRD